MQDLGYQGHAPKNAVIQMPMKSSKYKKLTEEEKNENKMKSSGRAVIEHAISGVKRCKIVKDIFRHCTTGYEMDDVRWMMAHGNTSAINHHTLTIYPDLPCGIYFVMVKTEYSSVVKKLVIAK